MAFVTHRGGREGAALRSRAPRCKTPSGRAASPLPGGSRVPAGALISIQVAPAGGQSWGSRLYLPGQCPHGPPTVRGRLGPHPLVTPLTAETSEHPARLTHAPSPGSTAPAQQQVPDQCFGNDGRTEGAEEQRSFYQTRSICSKFPHIQKQFLYLGETSLKLR